MTESTFDISTKALAQLVKPVIPLAGKDEMLPLLRAIHFQASGKYLTAAATDRFRVGVCRVELETAPPVDLGVWALGLRWIRDLNAADTYRRAWTADRDQHAEDVRDEMRERRAA